jgi:hypothetical protein
VSALKNVPPAKVRAIVRKGGIAVALLSFRDQETAKAATERFAAAGIVAGEPRPPGFSSFWHVQVPDKEKERAAKIVEEIKGERTIAPALLTV